jgi:hypothetical protein
VRCRGETFVLALSLQQTWLNVGDRAKMWKFLIFCKRPTSSWVIRPPLKALKESIDGIQSIWGMVGPCFNAQEKLLARPKAIVTGACLVPAKHLLVSLLLNQRVVVRLGFPTGLNRNMQHPVFQRIGERFRPKATLSR